MRRLSVASLALKCWRLRSLVLASMLVASSAAWFTVKKTEPARLADDIRSGTLVSQLRDVPSHNRRYRATLIPEVTGAREIAEWRLQIEKPDGKALAEPVVVMQSWMPEDSSVAGKRPKADYLGRGTFRVDGLRFARRGWWNVKVTIQDAGVTDSLAFNLIVP